MKISNSLSSPPSAVNNLLCNNLLDSSINSEETSELSGGHTTPNGTCDVEAELTDSEPKGRNLIGDNGLAAEALLPHVDLKRPKGFCLSSHLPVELSGLCHSEITPLCSSQSLHLSTCHVQKDDSLVLVIFITNSSDSAIQQILLDLDSEQLEVMHSAEKF